MKELQIKNIFNKWIIKSKDFHDNPYLLPILCTYFYMGTSQMVSQNFSQNLTWQFNIKNTSISFLWNRMKSFFLTKTYHFNQNIQRANIHIPNVKHVPMSDSITSNIKGQMAMTDVPSPSRLNWNPTTEVSYEAMVPSLTTEYRTPLIWVSLELLSEPTSSSTNTSLPIFLQHTEKQLFVTKSHLIMRSLVGKKR